LNKWQETRVSRVGPSPAKWRPSSPCWRRGGVTRTNFPNAARLPVHATALGKALVAFASNSLLNQLVVNGLPSYTQCTLTSEAQLVSELKRTRKRGFATAYRELDGFTAAVAAPVFDAVGNPVAAIEVQVAELGPESLTNVVPALLVAARAVSRELVGEASSPLQTSRLFDTGAAPVNANALMVNPVG
jgi:DNA-binding IclR family transcriptional regulator